MPSTQAAPGHFQRIALFAECISDLPLTRGKLIGESYPLETELTARYTGSTLPLSVSNYRKADPATVKTGTD